jgi:hypothetical protein
MAFALGIGKLEVRRVGAHTSRATVSSHGPDVSV